MSATMNRRTLIGGVGASVGLALKPAWSQSVPTDATDCVVRTAEGRLRGIRANGLDVYRGIPYGGPLTGENRFKGASVVKPWSGVREAIRLGAPAIQPPGGTYGVNEPVPDENCLFLNVWAPTGGAPGKPVMVYSHGGGWIGGSGGSVLADGGNLARENDVVVVATNHRLGLMGFLYLAHLGGEDYAGSGGCGVQDIATALAWVARNIAEFGGDPHNVTIFGESGGAAKTACLYAMPRADRFFGKAAIDSGPVTRLTTPDVAIESTDLLLKELGLDRASWRKLTQVPAAQLLAAQMKLGTSPNVRPASWTGPIGSAAVKPGEFGAVADGRILVHPFQPAAPAISRSKPLIVGGNEDEQHFFSLVTGDLAAWQLDEGGLAKRMATSFGANAQKVLAAYRKDRPEASASDLFFAVQSDLFSIQGSTVIAERKTRQGGAPAYRYIFTFDADTPLPGMQAKIGAMHGLDIAFKFNNMDAAIKGRPPFAGPRPDRIAAGRNMSRLWASFARNGKPSAPGQPDWPAYNLTARPTMYIDVVCKVVEDPHPNERTYWSKFA